VQSLTDALRRDASAPVRETAAWALGNIGAEKSTDVLTQALGDQAPAVRAVAMWALGNAGPATAPAGVVNALSSDDKRTRLLAAWTLFRIADDRAVSALEAAVARETDRDVRMAYIRAMGQFGERSAPALARLIDSPDADVRAVVVEALAGKGMGHWPWPWPRPRPFP
jgi:HEAT repeat protein